MTLYKSILQVLCCVVFSSNAFAQELPIKSFSLSSQQQAAMGVTFSSPTTVQTGSLLISASVTVPPDKQAIVSAPYPGQITRMFVDIGDSVKTGASMADFTSPQMGDARRLLLEATSDQRLAKESLGRDSMLFREGIIPQSRLNVTKAKSENADAMLLARQSELKAASINFEDSKANPSVLYATGTIKAPLSGTIVEAYNQIGQRVDTGTLLFKIADSSLLILEINTSAQKASSMQVGDEINIASRNAKAKILAVSQSVNASQASRIRASVIEKGSLKIGEHVTGTVLTKINQATAQKPTWTIPSRAITNWKGQSVVFVYSGNNIAMVPVTVFSSDDDTASVQASLPAQSKIAVTGVASLKALAQKAE
jgi:RND family efflux transporter MFP subunit